MTHTRQELTLGLYDLITGGFGGLLGLISFDLCQLSSDL